MNAVFTFLALATQVGIYTANVGDCPVPHPPQAECGHVVGVTYPYDFHPTMHDKQTYDLIQQIPAHPSKEWIKGFCLQHDVEFAYIYRDGYHFDPQIIRCRPL
jgi:hypothetical protein